LSAWRCFREAGPLIYKRECSAPRKALPPKVFYSKDAVATYVFEVLESRRRDWIFSRLKKALFAEVFRLKSGTVLCRYWTDKGDTLKGTAPFYLLVSFTNQNL
jgi:hypothetical protein